VNDGHTILWQRLDLPGHEIATIHREPDGWHVEGVAVLVESGRPCRIQYDIRCDAQWATRDCSLRGTIGEKALRLDIVRDTDGGWSANGDEVTAVRGCIDIDLGFSPVTNLLPIRRLSLSMGSRVDVRAAWVRFPELTVELLEQAYTHSGPDRYLYESRGGQFRRELTVDTFGCVIDYPGLWHAEATTPHHRRNEHVQFDGQ